MADIKISELTQAESLSTSDLLESAVPYNGGFLSRRMSLAQLSNYLENYVQHQALTTTAKTIVSAINEVLGDLANYYTISQTYSKTEVDTLIAGVSGLHFLVVSQLPTTDIDVNTIYLVPKQDVGTQDIYDEFIYIVEEAPTPSHWEKIGTTEIDLSDYVTDTELTNILNDYVTSSGLSTILANYATTSAMTTALADKVDKVSGKGLSTEDYTTAEKTKVNGLATVATSGSYNDLTDKPTIPTVNNKKISITQNGTAVDSFTLNQNSNKTIEVKDEKVKQTEMTDDRVLKSLAIASDNTTTTDTDGVEKCNGLAVRLRKQPRPGLASTVDLCIGNDIPVGTDNNYVGILRMFGTHEYSTNIHAGNSTDDREIVFPDADGTLALQSELPTNPVLWSENNVLGAKNLIPINTTEKSHTQNNVQFTLNEDGSIKAHITGTGTGGVFDVTTKADENLILPNGTYIFSGCPSGGSSSTYRCRVRVYNITTGTESSYGFDTGSGLTVTVNETEGKGIIEIACLIYSGYNGSDLLFKPMIRPSSIADNTYAPPSQTNRQLTTLKADYRQIADVELTENASRAYAKNELMIWRGDLYRVTSAISSGGAISSKVTATTLSAEIKAIRDALNI